MTFYRGKEKLREQFGGYLSELQTDTEPFGWSIGLESRLTANQEPGSRETMEKDACVMLATVRNLGYVTWRYSLDGRTKEYTITAEDATERIGYDIKSCSDSASAMQRLIRILNLA